MLNIVNTIKIDKVRYSKWLLLERQLKNEFIWFKKNDDLDGHIIIEFKEKLIELLIRAEIIKKKEYSDINNKKIELLILFLD